MLRPLERQVRQLRAFPRAGQWMPTVRAVSTTGDSLTLGETTSGRAQVLIFFTTTCPYCKENLDAWKRISSELAADSARRFDVVWVSGSYMDSTRAYVERNGITVPVVKMPSNKWIRAFQVKGVPMTMVLDHWGRVAHMHPSLFASSAARDSVVAAAYRAAAVDSVNAAVSDSLSRANGQ